MKKSSFSDQSRNDLKKRLVFLLLALCVYRIGAHIPVPFLDPGKLSKIFSNHTGGIFGLLNMFSGGAFSRFTLFALGVMPYISASIIMQLLSSVYAPLEQLKKDGGELGRRKINQYTRYATIAIAFLQALGIARWLESQGLVNCSLLFFYFIVLISLVAGTIILMWIGEQITERGIGNGVSMIIFTGIVCGLPSALSRSIGQVTDGQMQFLTLVLIFAIVIAAVSFVVFMECAQRRIPISHSNRYSSLSQSSSNYLPLKLNMSGVIPPIFASSVIIIPSTLAEWFSTTKHFSWIKYIGLSLYPGQPLYIFLFATFVIFFAFFYTSIVFNPKEMADNLKKSSVFIAGIRPGEQTAIYIKNMVAKLTVIGAIYLTLVTLLPEFMIATWHVPFYFGGTSLLIIVVVTMDLISQIQVRLMSGKYQNMMRNAAIGPSFSSK